MYTYTFTIIIIDILKLCHMRNKMTANEQTTLNTVVECTNY